MTGNTILVWQSLEHEFAKNPDSLRNCCQVDKAHGLVILCRTS